MKFRLLPLFALIFLMASCQTKQADNPADFTLGKGTNLAHFLSQSQARGAERASFITNDDIVQIAEMGFNHVRLPIDEEQMWDESGARHHDAFDLLTNTIDACIEQGLCVVVDLHIIRSHHFNAKEKPLWSDRAEQEKFFDLWRDLSKVLKKYPVSKVAYELMNEAVADDHEDWNRLVASAFSAIREFEPNRNIVIGSNRWQSCDTFDVLKVPANDPNIILSFHFYEPFLLSHYKASWTDIKEYEGAVHYPGVIVTEEEIKDLPESQMLIAKDWVGKSFDKETLRALMAKPIARSKALGLRLYCGEYGVLQTAPSADLMRWYQDIREIFEEEGINSANWNYKSNQFGLVFKDNRRYEPLIQTVVQ